ncbi:DUF4349 domain-containing protein [Kribbella sp. VKM Ac-2566]|uniref:DUF4349 domain-containing protein n=1 Tax=Kribbella sp. VKM Ac-2566 TaxID=2512218 RepID=UPI001062D203|nr:DUF4349 domain-containing protein [Kribbella sp. VKM Ac-2566]TDW91559.1 uncharacterized protein DUF4349 [Kribbella sp. VKM Ac-2566]
MRRIRAATAVVAVVGVVVLAGCGASGNDSTSGDAAPAPAAKQGSGSGESAGNAKPQAPTEGKWEAAGGGGNEQPAITRAIIKSGSLAVEGDDVSGMRQKAVAAIGSLEGQVASEDTGSDSDGKITRSNLVLKVPTKSFETAIQRLSDLGKRTQIHQESTDVTEQVVDVASRIESQRASLDRMRALMAKANTIGEIVSVESELTRREADLESLLAKQKNLALQTDLATLTLTLTEKGKPPAITEPKEDKGFVAGLKSGWNAFTAAFTSIATAVGALLPFLVLLAIILVPLWLFRSKLRRRPAALPPSAANSGQ